jgi:hypothetical protein
VDVLVVRERGDACCLRRTGHQHPDVLAHLLEVLDEVPVARIEADAETGEVRPLRERVDGDDTVTAGLEDRPRRAVPRELRVALVAEHRDPVATTPTPLRRRGRSAPGRGSRGC